MLAECCTVVGVSPVSTERRLCRVERRLCSNAHCNHRTKVHCYFGDVRASHSFLK